MATIEENKAEFISLCGQIHRDGIGDLMKWLDNSDFYVAPASAKYHGAKPGGLLEHSLDVYHALEELVSVYKDHIGNVSEETLVIISLFHDLCKVNFYGTETRNRKNAEGKWEPYTCYTYSEKFSYGGHGSKSVFLAQNFIKLTAEEAVCIQNHMSAWEDGAAKYCGAAYEQYPLAWILHVADEAATFLIDKERQNDKSDQS